MTDNQINKLPKNWTLKTLGEVCEILGGGTPSRNEPSFFGGNIAWITPTEINKEKINVISESKEYITEIGLKKSSARILPVNSVLMTTRAGIGSIAISGIEVTTNQGFTSFICSDSLNYFYLAYWLKSNKNEFEEKATGTTFKEISKTVIKNIQIPLPPLPEQQKIVQKIESLFTELKTGTKALKTALTQLKIYRQAVLNHFLTNDEWEKVRLKDVNLFITDGDHQAPPKAEKGIPFVVISNIKNNKLDLSKTRFVTDEYYENLSEYRKAQKGDILYTVTGSYGIPVLLISDEKFCFQRHIGLLKPNTDKISKEYLFYCLCSQFVFKQATNVATGTAQLTVPLSGLRNIKIPLPPIKIQTQIVSEIEKRMAGADALEASLKAQLINAENLRQSILKRAFEGRLV